MLSKPDGEVVGTISLRDSFFNPDLVMNSPEIIDQSLSGLMSQLANELDTQVIDGVRNFLFAPSGGIGTDLAALNMQRGRGPRVAGLQRDANRLRVGRGLGVQRDHRRTSPCSRSSNRFTARSTTSTRGSAPWRKTISPERVLAS